MVEIWIFLSFLYSGPSFSNMWVHLIFDTSTPLFNIHSMLKSYQRKMNKRKKSNQLPLSPKTQHGKPNYFKYVQHLVRKYNDNILLEKAYCRDRADFDFIGTLKNYAKQLKIWYITEKICNEHICYSSLNILKKTHAVRGRRGWQTYPSA